MKAQVPQVPLFRIMMSNATLLSIIYLVIGVVAETLRRFHPTDWVLRFSLVVDSLPARALALVGAMRPLRDAYVYGRIDEFWLRVIFGATSVAIIFFLALVVGAGMWIARRVILRRYVDG